MKIKDIKQGWLFQYKDGGLRSTYGVKTKVGFFNLSGTAVDCAGTMQSRHEAIPICLITDLTVHLPDYFA